MGRASAWTDDDGFTLIELMMVVMIIGILVAIALPQFLGTRVRAQDRRAQTDIAVAFTAEKAYYTDTLTYTTVPAEMVAIEAALDYVAGDTPLAEGVVYLHVHPLPNEVFISTMSESGTCFYLREADGGGALFAQSAACTATDGQAYGPSW